MMRFLTYLPLLAVLVAGSVQAACLGPEKMTSTMKPADFFNNLTECAHEEKYADAALSYNMADAYIQYDMRYLSKKSPKISARVYNMATQAVLSIPRSQQEKAQGMMSSARKDASFKMRTCRVALQIGPPAYGPPLYLLQPGDRIGLEEVNGVSPHDLWLDTLAKTFNCPTEGL